MLTNLYLFCLRLFARLRCGLYYINGAGTLPAPLNAAEEEDAMRRLSSGEAPEEVRRLLIEHNLRLVVYIAKKFENTGAGIEDLISIGTIGLIKAISTFRPERGIKLATYASRCIENEILMYLRKTSNLRSEVSIDEPLSVDWDGNELLLSDILSGDEDSVGQGLETQEERRVIREVVSALSARDRVIVELRFGLGGRDEHTQKDVADMLGISQSYISRLEKKIIARLREQIGALI